MASETDAATEALIALMMQEDFDNQDYSWEPSPYDPNSTDNLSQVPSNPDPWGEDNREGDCWSDIENTQSGWWTSTASDIGADGDDADADLDGDDIIDDHGSEVGQESWEDGDRHGDKVERVEGNEKAAGDEKRATTISSSRTFETETTNAPTSTKGTSPFLIPRHDAPPADICRLGSFGDCLTQFQDMSIQGTSKLHSSTGHSADSMTTTSNPVKLEDTSVDDAKDVFNPNSHHSVSKGKRIDESLRNTPKEHHEVEPNFSSSEGEGDAEWMPTSERPLWAGEAKPITSLPRVKSHARTKAVDWNLVSAEVHLRAGRDPRPPLSHGNPYHFTPLDGRNAIDYDSAFDTESDASDHEARYHKNAKLKREDENILSMGPPRNAEDRARIEQALRRLGAIPIPLPGQVEEEMIKSGRMERREPEVIDITVGENETLESILLEIRNHTFQGTTGAAFL